MQEPRQGYRVDRLQRRRRTKAERWQAWALYLLAGVVAFAAVLGAWYAAARFLGDEAPPQRSGYLALIALAASGDGGDAAAALVVSDAAARTYSLFVIPPELLVSGPQGEYVFAGDALATGTLREDLARVIGAPVDAGYRLTASALARLAGDSQLRIRLAEPVTLRVAGERRTFADGESVAGRDLAALFAAVTPDDGSAARLQVALWRAVLDTAALRPDAERTGAADRAASAATQSRYLADALRGLTAGGATVDLVPCTPRVAEGQFAYVPDPEGIMARITRKAPGFRARFTVVIRNGSGKVGIGEVVAARLAALDVELPAPVNADSFDYRQTRIVAGRDAVSLAEEIRAILRRGVVLNGAELPPDTVVVIVGGDLEATDIEPEDQP